MHQNISQSTACLGFWTASAALCSSTLQSEGQRTKRGDAGEVLIEEMISKWGASDAADSTGFLF